jgi:hypothetical protein
MSPRAFLDRLSKAPTAICNALVLQDLERDFTEVPSEAILFERVTAAECLLAPTFLLRCLLTVQIFLDRCTLLEFVTLCSLRSFPQTTRRLEPLFRLVDIP